MGKYIEAESKSHLEEVIKNNKYVLIDFTATWCPPCKMIAPIFEKLAEDNTKEGGLAFVKVDVDAQQEISKEYSITAMPTFILLENGKVLNTTQGANPPAIKTFVTHALQGLEKGEADKTEQPATLGTAV